jgi:hypothetical protein
LLNEQMKAFALLWLQEISPRQAQGYSRMKSAIDAWEVAYAQFPLSVDESATVKGLFLSGELYKALREEAAP